MCNLYLQMFFVYETLLGKDHEKCLQGVLGVDGRFILKLKLKELVLRVLAESVWIVMLVAGRQCDRVVEHMFCVSSECLDQLMNCATVSQCCSAVNCVVLWQALHTWQCSAECSALVCCFTMLSYKLIQLF